MKIRTQPILITLIITAGLYLLLFKVADFHLMQRLTIDTPINSMFASISTLHIASSIYALIAGAILFIEQLQKGLVKIYKRINESYVLALVISSLSGIILALFANGGLIATIGFVLLYMLMLLCAIRVYTNLKQGNLLKHKVMIIYSYALCVSVITFAAWYLILSYFTTDKELINQVVAWEGWLPNLFVADFITQNSLLPNAKQFLKKQNQII
jgi:hypothetical protein